MLYIIVGMSFLFITIGFIVTEKNAKNMLSGYNTMSEEARKKVDIKSYIPFFRKFHICLGISFLVIGLALTYLVSENAGGIFLGVYPILAYLYFIWSSRKYSKGYESKWSRVLVIVLVATLIFVVGLFFQGFKEDQLTFDPEKVEFHGSYGEEISISEIRSVELADQLPNIVRKTNGFALGVIRKGYFKTKEGEQVKLILNSDRQPYLLLTKMDATKIYFSVKEGSNEDVYDELKKTIPNIIFK